MTITLRDWAASYVRKCDPAMNGSRNNTAFGIAGHLWAAESESGERLSEHDIIDVMTDWNHRGGDPLPDDELRGVVKSAEGNGTPRQTKIIKLSGFAKPKPLSPVGTKSDPVPDVEIVSFDSLHKAHPDLPPAVIDGILRKGETANIIAASKVGKTWLTYGLALSIVTGRSWLDAFQCLRGRVLMLDNELNASSIAHRIPKVAEAMQIDRGEYADQIDVLSLRGKGVSIFDVRRYLQGIEHGYYNAVILDAKYRFYPPGFSENSNADEMSVYNQLDSYAESTGAAWLVVHHASKGSQGEKAVTDVGAGAGAQSRAADSHLILRPHEEDDCCVLDAAVRSFPPIEPVGLRWTFPTWTRAYSIDPTALKGRRTAGEERQLQRDAEGMDSIRGVLATGAATVRQVRDSTGFGKERCERLLGLLTSGSEITYDTIKIRGNDARKYRLKS